MKIYISLIVLCFSIYAQDLKTEYIDKFNLNCNYKNVKNCKNIAIKSSELLNEKGLEIAIQSSYAKKYFDDRMNVQSDIYDHPIWPKSDDFKYTLYRMFIEGELMRTQILFILKSANIVFPKVEPKIFAEKLHLYFLDKNDSPSEDVEKFRNKMFNGTIQILGDEYMSALEGLRDFNITNSSTKFSTKQINDLKEYLSYANEYTIQNICMIFTYNEFVNGNLNKEEFIEKFK